MENDIKSSPSSPSFVVKELNNNIFNTSTLRIF